MMTARYLAIFFALFTLSAHAAEANYPDLPPHEQVDAALSTNINVMNAETGVRMEQVNQRKWESGGYEFNLKTGSTRHQIIFPGGENSREWNIALERPLRLINKVMIDSDIGEEAVQHAHLTLGDARHEAGRLLLHLWFNWQREQVQVRQWQQQVENLTRQAETTEKRLKAGDAPRMELSQANAAVAQAAVARQQAVMRAELARNELTRQFPALTPLPEQIDISEPQPIKEDLAYWKHEILNDNHELEMARSERRFQQMLAERSRADRVPDPTVGVQYSNEIGVEKVMGVYFSIPISFGLRNANAENAGYQAQMAMDRENAVQRRLEGDIYAAYTQALSTYQIWLQAREAATSIGQNADLVARAYSLGESSLTETLAARRLALESALSESIAKLDANEARYRLLLDAHQLWPASADAHGTH